MTVLDQLDDLAREVSANSADGLQLLSFLPIHQRMYVVLAANRPELLNGTSLVRALQLMGADLREALIERY